MRKSIAFKRPASPEDWIESGNDSLARQAPAEPAKRTVRFTLDVDAELHSRMKIHCVRQGKPMSDVLRAVLAQEFPPE